MKKFKLFFFLMFFITFTFRAYSAILPNPNFFFKRPRYRVNNLPLHAPIVLVVDMDTNTVLYEKNANVSISPASLTKIVTIYTALKLADKQNVKLDDIISITPDAYYYNLPSDSSKMFLGDGQIVTFRDLLLGLSVSSGNDAGVAIAEKFSGSVSNFVKKMNENVNKLGLKDMHFVDSYGYDERNRITAESFAKFCLNYLDEYPWMLKNFHAVKEFAYPKKRNLLNENISDIIVQKNKNTLLKFEGVTGLKTGYIDESGYNIALTAKRDGKNILIIALGIKPKEGERGILLREEDGAFLLDYAYNNFSRMPFYRDVGKTIKVIGGNKNKVNINFKSDLLTIPKEYENKINIEIKYADEIKAPLKTSDSVGYISYYYNKMEFYGYALHPNQNVKELLGIKKIFSNIVTFFSRTIFGEKPPTVKDLRVYHHHAL